MGQIAKHNCKEKLENVLMWKIPIHTFHKKFEVNKPKGL